MWHATPPCSHLTTHTSRTHSPITHAHHPPIHPSNPTYLWVEWSGVLKVEVEVGGAPLPHHLVPVPLLAGREAEERPDRGVGGGSKGAIVIAAPVQWVDWVGLGWVGDEGKQATSA